MTENTAMATRTQGIVVPGRSRLRHVLRTVGGPLVAYIVLIVMAIVSIFPFAWMISTSLKGAGQIFAWPPQLIPSPIEWHNYAHVFELMPFGRFFLNTVFYAVCVTAGQLFFCSMAGFAFGRLRFPGRDLIFMLYLGTLMIPATVTLVPSFILMRWFHWVDTIWAMTIPGMLGSAFGTFLMRQFFLTLPTELDDAATIDGASRFRVFWQVDLPLSRPALAVLAIFTITTVWNDFMWPLVMLHNEKLFTLTLGLASIRGGIQSPTFWAELMGAATMSVIPLILIFLFAQKFFTEGIALTGMGGR